MTSLIEIARHIRESYSDVGVDAIKNRSEKLTDYTDYINKKVINNVTYLNFQEKDEEWYLWGKIIAFDNADETEVGNASYGKLTKNSHLKGSIDVRPDKRRQGIGSNMYEWIEQLIGEKLYPDVPHSKSASKFWNNPKRKFGFDK